MAKLTGLDNVLQLGKINFNGITQKLDVGNLLDIAVSITTATPCGAIPS